MCSCSNVLGICFHQTFAGHTSSYIERIEMLEPTCLSGTAANNYSFSELTWCFGCTEVLILDECEKAQGKVQGKFGF